jgi:protein MpaA
MSGQWANGPRGIPRWVCVLLLGVGLGAGCAEQVEPPRVTEERALQPVSRIAQRVIAGWSVERRPIMLHVLGEGDDVTFFLAGIHGDETAGSTLLRRLSDYLERQGQPLRDKRILILPVANPDGKANQARQNGNGVDLNRNFPAPNHVESAESGRAGLSEPEALAIYRIIHEYRPDRIVSVHQPLGCVDYDGAGEDLANRMAAACGLPVKKLGARPGSLGSYSSQVRQVPIVTLELLDTDSQLSDEQLWSRYGKALLEALQ